MRYTASRSSAECMCEPTRTLPWMQASTQACPHACTAALSRTFSSLAITMMDVEGSSSRLLIQTWRQKSWIKTLIFHPPPFFLSVFFLFSSIPSWQPLTNPPTHTFAHTHIFFLLLTSLSYIVFLTLSVSQTMTCELEPSLRGLHVILADRFSPCSRRPLGFLLRWRMWSQSASGDMYYCD